MKCNYIVNERTEIMKKPIIMQHNTASFMNNGGPATGFRMLMESHLKNKYQFIPLNEPEGKKSKLSLLINLISQIKRVNPDLVHVRGLQSSGFYGLIAARLAGCKKVVVSVHGISIDSRIGTIKKFIYKRLIEPFTLRNADLVYCVCNYAAKRPYIFKNTKNLYGFIHNAAPDYSNFNHEKLRSDFRTELGILKHEIVVTFVGRVVIDKGIEYLAESIKILEDQSSIRFLIVGDGGYLNNLKISLSKEIESKKVILLGKRSDIATVLFATDIFVFPTLRENLSNVLLEASEARLAIIATNVGGNPEIIQDNFNGILIPSHDSHELAKQIRYLVNNPDVRERLGTNAQKNVQLNFSQQLIFDQLDKAYSTVLGL